MLGLGVGSFDEIYLNNDTASDNGVLGATLGHGAGIDETCRPWVWKQNGKSMRLLFRDHFLSDLIGFVYSRMEPAQAAAHFLDRIRDNARRVHSLGRDALVPVILDGENAWEHYERNGRPFLKELYRLISADRSLEAVTVSEALKLVPAGELTHIHPGSWINANFDIWIGASEDNQAWEYLLDARQAWEKFAASPAFAGLDPARRRTALFAAALAPFAALLLQLFLSRTREYAADETGARMVGQPYGLISALEKLGAYNRRIPTSAISPSISSLCIVRPMFGGGTLSSLFSTHPPLEDRIAALRQMVNTPLR